MFDKALDLGVLGGRSFCLFGNPVLKMGVVSDMVCRFAPGLELNRWDTMNTSFCLFLLALPPFLPPFLPSSVCSMVTITIVILSLGKAGGKNF